MKHSIMKEARRMSSKEKGPVNIWQGFQFFGIVGWTVVIPALLAVMVGVWLDLRCAKGSYGWTLMLLLSGIGLGCVLALMWLGKEISKKNGDSDDKQ